MAVRIWAREASYLFFGSVATTTMASSFFLNLVASTAWRSVSVAIVSGGVTHQMVARLTRDAT
jgi:hypothetical protein